MSPRLTFIPFYPNNEIFDGVWDYDEVTVFSESSMSLPSKRISRLIVTYSSRGQKVIMKRYHHKRRPRNKIIKR